MNISFVISEIQTAADVISGYLKDISGYLTSKTGTPLGIEEVIPQISSDVLSEVSWNLKEGSRGYSSGAIASSIYDHESYLREASIVSTLKFQYYARETSGLQNDADEISSDVSKSLNTIRGYLPEQDITL